MIDSANIHDPIFAIYSQGFKFIVCDSIWCFLFPQSPSSSSSPSAAFVHFSLRIITQRIFTLSFDSTNYYNLIIADYKWIV